MAVVMAVPFISIMPAVPIMAARATVVGSIPAAVAHVPPAATLLPHRGAVDVARARTQPDAADPDVSPAAHFPMAGGPDMSDTRLRHAFEARWRRGPNVHGDRGLGQS